MTANDSALVATEWVAQRLDDRNTRIIETDSMPGSYYQAHLPGAVFVPYGQAFVLPLGGLPMQAPREHIQNLLGKLGIIPEMSVVLYNEHHNQAPSGALWVVLAENAHPFGYWADWSRQYR